MDKNIRDNAIHCEVRKIAYRQSKDGVVVSFVVHPNEVPQSLATAELGTRYMLALVEIGDDEQPKERQVVTDEPERGSEHKTKPGAAPTQPRRALMLSQECALACGNPDFQQFLHDKFNAGIPLNSHNSEAVTAEYVRTLCCVESRSLIKPNTPPGDKWKMLYGQFTLQRDYPELENAR